MTKPLLLFCLLVLPVTLQAQEPRAQLERARSHNWYVRAAHGDSIIATGRVRAIEVDRALIDDRTIAFNEFTALERRTKVGGGWKYGAVGGTLVVGLLFMSAHGIACESDCDFSATEVAGSFAVGSLLGVPLGGMIGELVRPGKHVWRRVWPTPGN